MSFRDEPEVIVSHTLRQIVTGVGHVSATLDAGAARAYGQELIQAADELDRLLEHDRSDTSSHVTPIRDPKS